MASYGIAASDFVRSQHGPAGSGGICVEFEMEINESREIYWNICCPIASATQSTLCYHFCKRFHVLLIWRLTETYTHEIVCEVSIFNHIQYTSMLVNTLRLVPFVLWRLWSKISTLGCQKLKGMSKSKIICQVSCSCYNLHNLLIFWNMC